MICKKPKYLPMLNKHSISNWSGKKIKKQLQGERS